MRGLLEAARRGVRATLVAIFVSAILAAAKILAGIAGYAYALIADGIESMLDIMSALVVLGSLRIASAPPNERYPYGYGRAETLGSFVIATGLIIAAISIAIQSIREILIPHHMPASWTLIVLLVVAITKEILFRFLSRTASEIESRTVGTDAWHHRSDALTSAAAFIGISIALVGGPGYEAADDWAALFACGIIAFNGYRLFRSALRDVMDAAPPAEIEHQLREISLTVDGVEQVDKCLARRSGFGYFVDMHIEVDGRIPVSEGHEIAHAVKDSLIRSKLRVLDANIHVEPHPRPYK